MIDSYVSVGCFFVQKKKGMRIMKKKTYKNYKNDAEYISYIERGESAAVFVTRDICSEINTSGKWIDVIDLDTYDKWYDIEKENKRAFNYIIVEIFNREIRPKYPPKASEEEKKYITWRTAHADIAAQREEGVRGPVYLVLCHLFENKNAKKKKDRWSYRIRKVKKVSDKQVEYIDKHKDEIIQKIKENRRPDIKFFEPSSQKNSKT